ncbi:MAG: hypothetical protein LUG96_02280 [Tannerellaceae bacterium]|nr:hypothetical protein [Tannerellaceae bacterium]
MSLAVIVVKRKVLAGEDAGQEKWYGQVRSGTWITFEKLCKQISHHCMVTYADVSGVMREVLNCAANILDDGSSVQLGRVGNLRLSAGSYGVEEEPDFTLREMKTPRVIFSPGKVIRDMLREVKFRKENVKVVEKEIPCDLPHEM